MRLNITIPNNDLCWKKFIELPCKEGSQQGVDLNNIAERLIQEIAINNDGPFLRDRSSTQISVDETNGDFSSVQKLMNGYPNYIKKIFIAQYYNISYASNNGKYFDVEALFTILCAKEGLNNN